jgi:hypothetical protein
LDFFEECKGKSAWPRFASIGLNRTLLPKNHQTKRMEEIGMKNGLNVINI